LDLGLTEGQVAKALATFPPILGLSIEQNLKPTVQYLLDLGLTEGQVAKVLATFPPILGLSIEQNLKLTFGWLQGFGVQKVKFLKLLMGWPRLLGYSISNNFEPKAALLEELCSPKGARDIIAKNPEILRFSYKRLATRLIILIQRRETSKVYSAMSLTDEAFARRFRLEGQCSFPKTKPGIVLRPS
jgi:mTERF domain-containing protein